MLRLDSLAERFGEVLHTRQTAGFLVRLSSYAPRLSIPLHCHEHAYFSYILRGGLHEWSGATEHRYVAGSVHFHPAHDPHQARTGPEGLVTVSIGAHGPMAHRLLAGVTSRSTPSPELTVLASRCVAALREDDDVAALLIESHALEMVASMVRQHRRRDGGIAPRWVSELCDHLRARFAERFSLQDLAAVARVHPVHVVRGFRRHVGVTPGAYLRTLRIDAARRALLASDEPISGIAFAVGFSSQAHLTRVFTRSVGLAPGAYRRLHRGRRN